MRVPVVWVAEIPSTNKFCRKSLGNRTQTQTTRAHGLLTPATITTFAAQTLTVEMSNKIGTINEPSDQYIASFTLTLTGPSENWSNIIRLTSTNNQCCNYGDRLQLFGKAAEGDYMYWCVKDNSQSCSTSISGVKDGIRTDIKFVSDYRGNRIYIDGKPKYNVDSKLQDRPAVSHIDVWASDRFSRAAWADIKDFKYYQIKKLPEFR